MIAKIVKGQTFRGVVNYVLNPEKQAEVMDSQGVRIESVQTIVDSFSLQTELNPRIKKPVGHISLDFSARDKEKLSNEKMIQISKIYMDRMGIKDTQYLLVRHFDKEHPHVHLIFNRVDNNAKTISDQNDRYRSERICKDLTRQFGLYFAPGKDYVKVHRLREPDKTKYTIYLALKAAVSKSKNWDDLIGKLKEDRIAVEFKFKGKTSEVQGVNFSMDGYRFSGSKVDRQFSFSKITSRLAMNQKSEQVEVNRQFASDRTERSVLGNYLGSLIANLQKQNEWEKQQEQKNRFPRIKRSKGIRR